MMKNEPAKMPPGKDQGNEERQEEHAISEESKEELKEKVRENNIIGNSHSAESHFPEIIELNVELSDEEKNNLVPIVREAFEICTTEKEIASYIKRKFDCSYTPGWNCIVGTLPISPRKIVWVACDVSGEEVCVFECGDAVCTSVQVGIVGLCSHSPSMRISTLTLSLIHISEPTRPY
eukprot:TRINITY_DN3621_c0_g1_i12.p1 TRINITY_DN3621_c0_g1~~TRINITY_DN3621_c0_g1_i12.p1  ORF type:complete len:178 (+),score=25.51 TRINITY_DN3621_c0_g1_i12:119-652(+)